MVADSATLLQEVFLNLMTNARHALLEKFDGRGGTFRIRAMSSEPLWLTPASAMTMT